MEQGLPSCVSGSGSRAGPVRSDVLWPGAAQRGPASHPVWGKVRVTGDLPAPGPSRSLRTGSECCPWTDPRTLPSLRSTGMETRRPAEVCFSQDWNAAGLAGLTVSPNPDRPAGGAVLKWRGSGHTSKGLFSLRLCRVPSARKASRLWPGPWSRAPEIPAPALPYSHWPSWSGE